MSNRDVGSRHGGTGVEGGVNLIKIVLIHEIKFLINEFIYF